MQRLGYMFAAAGLVGLALSVAASAQDAPERPGPAATSSDLEDEASPLGNQNFVREPGDQNDVDNGRTERVITPAQTRLQIQGRATTSTPRQGVSFLRASSFVGMPIMGTGNTQLGTVSDVLIDPNTFGLQYVIVDPAT